tara:strand:+ start:9977 stop:10792 length:816 start_codon:yes stop_codon:yes gene_type:complete
MNFKNNITVGIPFYNKVDINHLSLCIESILNQSIKPKIIHLIQDGEISSLIREKIDYYINKYPDLFLLLELPKKGLPFALNQSIKITKTKYYARMDADDIAIKNRFEIQIKYLEENPNIDILGSWAYEFENDSDKDNLYINKTPNDIKKINEYFHYRNPLIHPSVIFRITFFKKIGLYNEKMLTDQDLELWGRALYNKINISNIQKPLLFLRTKNRLIRRSRLSAIKRQIIIRYSYNTCSFKLNLLKLAAIFSRILPLRLMELVYKNFRNF